MKGADSEAVAASPEGGAAVVDTGDGEARWVWHEAPGQAVP